MWPHMPLTPDQASPGKILAADMRDAAGKEGTAPERTILCVDDEPNILSSLRRLFRSQGYRIFLAESGSDALQVLERETVDLVISDMRMPAMDGAEFLGRVRSRWPDTIRLLLTGFADLESTISAINKGEIYRYINKPWNDNDMLLVVRRALERKALEREKERLEALNHLQNEELRELNANLEAKVLQRTAELTLAHDSLAVVNEKLKANFLASIDVFSNLVEMRGGPRAGHSRRVADLSRKIAVKMELGGSELRDVFLAGLLHDIGKIGFPDPLLSTPASHLSPEDLIRYRRHAAQAEQALMAFEDLQGVAKCVRSRHERFDVNGFPEALAGTAIPLGARILALASDYDSLQLGTLSARPATLEEAQGVMVEGRGTCYDPRVVEAFLSVLGGVEPNAGAGLPLTAQDLQSGMVLARELATREGVLLLSAGHVLDGKLVQRTQGFEASEGAPMNIYIVADRST
jgi:response regulator RpfG family c-di-GMP phosphodiesterase